MTPPGEESARLVSIYSCADNAQASIIRSVLEQAEIFVHIQGENHRSLLGAVGTYVDLYVMVRQEDAERARAVIDEAEAQFEAGALSISDDEAAGGLSEMDSSGAMHLAPPSPEERAAEAPETSPKPRSIAYPIVLGTFITFGAAHAYAGAYGRAVGLALVEIFALYLVLSGVPWGLTLVVSVVLFDVISGVWLVRTSNSSRAKLRALEEGNEHGPDQERPHRHRD